jgi:hypothetical protein
MPEIRIFNDPKGVVFANVGDGQDGRELARTIPISDVTTMEPRDTIQTSDHCHQRMSTKLQTTRSIPYIRPPT